MRYYVGVANDFIPIYIKVLITHRLLDTDSLITAISKNDHGGEAGGQAGRQAGSQAGRQSGRQAGGRQGGRSSHYFLPATTCNKHTDCGTVCRRADYQSSAGISYSLLARVRRPLHDCY